MSPNALDRTAAWLLTMNAQLLEDEGLGPDPPHRDRLRSKEELSQAEKVKLDWVEGGLPAPVRGDWGLERALVGDSACSCHHQSLQRRSHRAGRKAARVFPLQVAHSYWREGIVQSWDMGVRT